MYLMQEKSEAAEDNSSVESHKQIAVILNAALPPPPVNQPPTRVPRPAAALRFNFPTLWKLFSLYILSLFLKTCAQLRLSSF